MAAAPPAPAGQPAENAITPKHLEAKVTFHCIGLKWDIAGDANRDATCKVLVRRKGVSAWREAMELFRVAFRPWEVAMSRDQSSRPAVNALSGSIFHLAAGTTCEIRLALADPDGGSIEKTLEVTTHSLPQDPPGARMLTVPPGRLQKVCAGAQPGDILLLGKGERRS